MTNIQMYRLNVYVITAGIVIGSVATVMAGPYSPGKGGAAEAGYADAGIAGFVGAAGDGVAATAANGNYVNPIFAGWATGYTLYSPSDNVGTYGQNGIGPQFADPTKALGPVTGNNMDIVTLGDMDLNELAAYTSNPSTSATKPGTLILTFDDPIRNGDGADFAAFENGFISNYTTGAGSTMGMMFAELGYVEVSTDGVTWAQFPSQYLNYLNSIREGRTNNSVDLDGNGVKENIAYLTQDVSNIYNLVGKHANAYSSSWGTPFNLDDLADDANVLNHKVDLNNIKYVKIVDIPGDGTFKDSNGNPIYDAWVTWGSGGLDFEALGVINYSGVTLTPDWDNTVDADTRAFVESDVTLAESKTIGALQFNGTHTIRGAAVTLGEGNRGITISDPNNAGTLSSDILGTHGLRKQGQGVLIFDGAKSYTGETVVEAGTLQGTAPSLARDITNRAKVRFMVSGDQRYNNVISGTGTVEIQGDETSWLTFEQHQAYTGLTHVASGNIRAGLANVFASASSLQVDQDAKVDLAGLSQTFASISGSGSIDLGSGGAALTLAPTAETNFEGTLSGVGDLNINGSSVQIFSHQNLFRGTVNLLGGMLAITSGESLGNSTNTVNFAGGTLRFDGTDMHSISQTLTADPGGVMKLYVLNSSNTVEISQNLSGDFSVSADGDGTVKLSGNNTFTGGVTISYGAVEITSQSQLGSGPLNFNGGILRIAGNELSTLTQPIVGNAFNLDIVNANHTYTVGSEFNGSGNITKYGAGKMILSSAAVRTGQTVAYDGEVIVQSSSAIDGNSGLLGTSKMTLQNGVTNSKSISVREQSKLTLENGASSTGRIALYDNGLLDLADNTVVSGTLSINGGTVSGSGKIKAATTFCDGSILSPGHSPGTLNFEDVTLTLQTGAIYHYEVGLNGGDLVLGVGTLDNLVLESGLIIDIVGLDGADVFNLDLTLFSGFESIYGSTDDWTVYVNGQEYSDYTVNIDGGNVTMEVVPEPSACALLVISGGITGLWARRRMKKMARK